MWNFPLAVFVQGCIINGFFGLCTAFFAHQFDVGGAVARVSNAGSDARESAALSTH
jgi:hypothetical protein